MGQEGAPAGMAPRAELIRVNMVGVFITSLGARVARKVTGPKTGSVG